jgi:hypothetical protein
MAALTIAPSALQGWPGLEGYLMKPAHIEPSVGAGRQSRRTTSAATARETADRVVTPGEVLDEIGTVLAVVLAIALVAQWLANAVAAG